MTFSPSKLKFVPEFLGVRESREMRLKEFLCTHVGYLRWAPNVTVDKMEITFFSDRGSNPVRWTQSPTPYLVPRWTQSTTLYRVAIKAGLYLKQYKCIKYLYPVTLTLCNKCISTIYTSRQSVGTLGRQGKRGFQCTYAEVFLWVSFFVATSIRNPQLCRCGSNEYQQSMFLSRNKKYNVYPCKPQFYYIKVGFKWVKIYRHVFVM